MKIVFVVPNLGPGGAERVVSILSASFAESNIDVDIFLLQDNRISYQISDKVNVVYYDMNMKSRVNKLLCMRKYFSKQKRSNAKLVIIPFLDVCLKYVLASTIGLNIPVIACERNDPYQKGTSLISLIKANLLYLLATHCVFQTLGAKDYYCDLIKRNCSVIMNPVVMLENVKWKGLDSKRLLSVGRLEPQKNHMLLINAFYHINKEFPEYVLEIYGEGLLWEELQCRINELNLERVVRLCGYSASIHSIMEDSFLFIMTSDYEGMSNALIEALAIGMPTITTNHPSGGAQMLVKDGVNGVLIPVNDEYALICALKRVIKNHNFACQIGENALEVREMLSVKYITNEWLRVIESL